MKIHFYQLLLPIIATVTANIATAQKTEKKFQYILDTSYQANLDVTGIMFHVEAPDQNISWTSAVGLSDLESRTELHKDQPVLIASNTKTYVSAATIKLVEKEHFKLDDAITNLISTPTAKLLKSDGYDLNAITVRHLLSHTSGIADYVDDDYFKFIQENPGYQWTRDAQIQRAVEVGQPLDSAGKQHEYGDINYLLLTEILERFTKQPFYTAIRELLDFKGHQLNST